MNEKETILSPIPLTPFPQQFSCVEQFLAAYRVNLPKSKQRINKSLRWRLTERIVGHIHAVDNSFGVLQATNGVLCIIIQDGGRGPVKDAKTFLGHIAWFVPQEQDHVELVKQETSLRLEAVELLRQQRREALLSAYD